MRCCCETFRSTKHIQSLILCLNFSVACLYECEKKMLNKNSFVCPPKNKNVPQNSAAGRNCPPVTKS